MSSLPAGEKYAANQAGLEQIDQQEVRFNRQVKLGKFYKNAGRLSFVASLAAAGVLMTTSHKEKSDLMIRIDTEMVAAMVGVLGGYIGSTASGERRKAAGKIADDTLLVSQDLGIDAPSWVLRGRRDRDELLKKTAETLGTGVK